MALNQATLAGLIRTNLLNDPLSGATDNAALTALCNAIAKAVIDHIKAAAVVSVVTTCGAGAGTGTGTPPSAGGIT